MAICLHCVSAWRIFLQIYTCFNSLLLLLVPRPCTTTLLQHWLRDLVCLDSAHAPERQMSQGRTVLCVGDSHTDATAGASFVQPLQQQNKHLQFVASGVNGEPSEVMARRLPKLFQQYPNPAAVIILAGSNDCLEQQNWGIHLVYKVLFRMSNPATQHGFITNVISMVETVKSTSPQTKVIVITCPPLTEQPDNPAFKLTTEYNSALQAALSKQHPDVHIADLHSRCAQFLELNRHNNKQLQLPPVQFNILSWFWWQPTAVLRHYLFQQSWNDISDSRGLMLLTDHVHMNQRAAELLVPLVQPFLDEL